MFSLENRFKGGIFCLLALYSLTMLLSCGGSDSDTDNNNGNGALKVKHISKIVEETQGTIRERMFMMEIDYRGVILAPYVYTNMVWSAGLIIDVNNEIVLRTDPILLATGFYGKLPKNLPSKCDNVSYEYITSGGLVTKIKKVTEDTTGYYPEETCTINITWE